MSKVKPIVSSAKVVLFLPAIMTYRCLWPKDYSWRPSCSEERDKPRKGHFSFEICLKPFFKFILHERLLKKDATRYSQEIFQRGGAQKVFALLEKFLTFACGT
jgi:hypothetical protein